MHQKLQMFSVSKIWEFGWQLAHLEVCVFCVSVCSFLNLKTEDLDFGDTIAI